MCVYVCPSDVEKEEIKQKPSCKGLGMNEIIDPPGSSFIEKTTFGRHLTSLFDSFAEHRRENIKDANSDNSSTYGKRGFLPI